MKFLWTKDDSDVPEEWSTLNLCRVFHCLPDELERQDGGKMNMLIRLLKVEGEVAEREKQKGNVAKKPGVPEKKPE